MVRSSLIAKLIWEANFILLPQVVGNALPERGKLSEAIESNLGKRVEAFREASGNI